MTTILEGSPATIWATLDRKYGDTTVHSSQWAAERERARDPEQIIVVAYVLAPPRRSTE